MIEKVWNNFLVERQAEGDFTKLDAFGLPLNE